MSWTGTPSANGNVSFDNDLNATKNLVIGASLHKFGDASVGVIAIPYQYSSAREGYCSGFHLIAEGGNPSTPFTSAVAGYIFYIPISV